MTIFDFLVLKIENLGFENPYKHVLGEFGEFWKNRYFWAQKWQGGSNTFKNVKKSIFFEALGPLGLTILSHVDPSGLKNTL